MPAHSKRLSGFSSRGNCNSGSIIKRNDESLSTSLISTSGSNAPSKGAGSPFFRTIAAFVKFVHKLIKRTIINPLLFIAYLFQHPKKFVFFSQSLGLIKSGNYPKDKADKTEPTHFEKDGNDTLH